jgi:hypothetical protein
MSDFSRRAFLKGSSAALVAAGTLAALPAAPAVINALESQGPADAGAADAAATEAVTAGEATAGSLAQPIIAHVQDLANGEIALFTGTSQVLVKDPQLAARLARAIG